MPAGFPTVDASIASMKAMLDAGVDVIEVELPYSDPVMDGPTIQAAAQQALEGGVRIADVLRVVEGVAATGVATLVMTYWNPVERYGVDAFAADLAAAGGAGLITPDIIPDEAAAWIAASDRHDLDRVFLVAPSSTDARLRMTVQACRGWVYAASTMGVTGVRQRVDVRAQVLVERTRAAGGDLVCVGLGVSTREQATQVASFADGVIVGSALVRAVGVGAGDAGAAIEAVTRLVGELSSGVAEAAPVPAPPPAGVPG
jgi:tryptophan synthase alpha chain